ncbi:MAG: large conductance mechanosensitive channel protein MscL [Acidimicrobiia bacterium]|nr:large conductance mechanosensitive channel protein MscL [Acidimicrobiia bacterium]
MIQEFKEFVNKGNLVEIAVAFVMGVAFADVIAALTNRIISPIIGMIFNLESLAGVWTFGELDPETGQPVGSVGAFIEAFINFLIVAFVMFMVVRWYNRMKARMEEPAEEAPAEDPEDVKLLREIRDNLKAQA